MAWERIGPAGDVGVAARAATLEELFAECARAMVPLLADAPAPAQADNFPVAGAEPAEEKPEAY